jgi:hypothetical protein
MKDSKTKAEDSTRLEYTGLSHSWCHTYLDTSETPSLLSYTMRYVSFTEVVSVCRIALREPMNLCTCVSEEGGDREGAGEGGDT